MEQQNGVGGVVLRDRAQRSAFFARYRDEVYALALDLTHESTAAMNLVRDVFNEAFKKFADSPCPADSQPYLYATTFLVFSRGPSEDTKNNVTDPVFAPPAEARSAQGANARQLPPYGPNPGAYPVQTQPQSFGGASVPPQQNAQQGYNQPGYAPYGQPASGYQQAARPAGSAYGSSAQAYAQPGQTYARQAGYGANQPPYAQQAPNPQGASAPGASASTAYAYGAPDAAAGPSVPPVENPYAQAPSAKPFEPLRNIDQKVEAPTGPYIGKTGKRRRRSTVLLVLNILLFFILLWVLFGLLIRLELIPEYDLGYEWFNKTLFPLF